MKTIGNIRKFFLLLALMMMGVVNTAKAAEAYAVYSNGTLTFYFDNNRSSRTGTKFDVDGSLTSADDSGWHGYRDYITSVIFDASFANARPTGTAFWFHGCEAITSITGIQNLNTSQVTDMYSMFARCSELTSLDVSHFNTAKVTRMNYMFWNCSSLTYLDVSSFNIANVTSMYNMFEGCSSLTTIYCENSWSTNASSSDMFKDCTKLVSQTSGLSYDSSKTNATYANPITGYFTSNTSYAVFTGSNNTLTFYRDTQRASRPGISYDLDKYNSGNLPYWVEYKDVIQHVVFDPSFSNARPTTTRAWFSGMTQLSDITGLQYLNTQNVTLMNSMFYNCQSLTNIDLTSFNTDKVTNMNSMFVRCTGLTSLDLSSFNTANVTSMQGMFLNCSNLKTIIVGDNWNTSAVSDSYQMFSGCASIVGRNGTRYDASHVDKEYARFDNAPASPGYFCDINNITPITYNVSITVEASAPQSHFITNTFWVRPGNGEYDNLYANQSAMYTLSKNSNFTIEMVSQEDPTWGIYWSPKAIYVNGKDKTNSIVYGTTASFELVNITGDTEIRVVFEHDCNFVRVTNLSPADSRSLYWTDPNNNTHEIEPQTCSLVPVRKNSSGVTVYAITEDHDIYEPKGYWYNGINYMDSTDVSKGGMYYNGGEIWQGDEYCMEFVLQPTAEPQDRTVLLGLLDNIPTSDNLVLRGANGAGGMMSLCYELSDGTTAVSNYLTFNGPITTLKKSELGHSFTVKLLPFAGRTLRSLYVNNAYKANPTISGDTLIWNLGDLAANYDEVRITAIYNDTYNYTKRKVTFLSKDQNVLVFTTGRKTPFTPGLVSTGYYVHTYNVGDTYQVSFISEKEPVKVSVNGEDLTNTLTIEDGRYYLPERTLTNFDECVILEFDKDTPEWTVVKTAEVEDAQVVVTVNGSNETTSLTDACTEIYVSNATSAQLRVKGSVSSSTYDLYLNAYDIANHKIDVIRVVREITGLGLVEAKALVESAPVKVKGFATRAEAEAAMATLTAIEGTQCSVKSPGVGTFVKVLRNGVDVTADMTPDGDYLMMNVDAADLTSTTWVITTEELINRFDTNNDGKVDISDVTKLVNEVLNK